MRITPFTTLSIFLETNRMTLIVMEDSQGQISIIPQRLMRYLETKNFHAEGKNFP